jgi:hypothetical protein
LVDVCPIRLSSKINTILISMSSVKHHLVIIQKDVSNERRKQEERKNGLFGVVQNQYCDCENYDQKDDIKEREFHSW